jgi:5'-3' exonuclease
MSDTADKFAILIDSSSLLHSAFHVVKPKLGVMDEHPMDVAAVNNYMRYVAREMYGPYSTLKFDLLVHALDSDGSDFRRALSPIYKGTRSAKHPALIAQESMMGRSLEALGEHVVQRRGVEADDLIASMTVQLVAEGYKVCIITKDKDLMQLVKDGEVVIARYEKNAEGNRNEHVFYEENDVFNKLKVYPSQVAAYLAMMGDVSDNIKGVKGIGPKTAAGLLADYGSMESLITRADEIKGKMGENFRDARDNGDLDLAYKLTLPLFDLNVNTEVFKHKTLVNEADAIKWHKALGLGDDKALPLRLSEFDKVPGYTHGPAATAPAPAPTPAPRVAAAVSAPSPAPATPVASAPASDPFLSHADPFGEGLDTLTETFSQPFVSPPPRTAAEVTPATESAASAPRRFQRRPG